jgi:hypothetical protein
MTPEPIPMPASIARLPACPTRKVPVPWFVEWIEGKPEFRVMDGRKLGRAIRERLCWVCGEPLKHRVTFLIGPMCVINRVSAEPPSHPDCAVYSARACPFLSRPHMVRREGGLPEEATTTGVMILRNPGVICLWTTRAPGAEVMPQPEGGILLHLFPPTALDWYCEGRAARRGEVLESVQSGLPGLVEIAGRDPRPGAMAALDQLITEAEPLWPRDERTAS